MTRVQKKLAQKEADGRDFFPDPVDPGFDFHPECLIWVQALSFCYLLLVLYTIVRVTVEVDVEFAFFTRYY